MFIKLTSDFFGGTPANQTSEQGLEAAHLTILSMKTQYFCC